MNYDFDAIIADAATRYGVPFEWIKAVIGTESGFDLGAVREEPRIGDRSIGLMQLLTGTARDLGFTGPEEMLFDPATNINYGTMLLEQLMGRCGPDFERVYAAYNSGKCDGHLTSSQVRVHVDHALEWLARVTTDVKKNAPEAAGGGLVLLALLFWWLSSKRRRRP